MSTKRKSERTGQQDRYRWSQTQREFTHPVPPFPAVMMTVLLSLGSHGAPARLSAPTIVIPTVGTVPIVSISIGSGCPDRLAGSFARTAAGRETYSACPPYPPKPHTRSPTSKPTLFGPTAATTPAASNPLIGSAPSIFRDKMPNNVGLHVWG